MPACGRAWIAEKRHEPLFVARVLAHVNAVSLPRTLERADLRPRGRLLGPSNLTEESWPNVGGKQAKNGNDDKEFEQRESANSSLKPGPGGPTCA
jgi:hypothetical protein